MNTNPDEASLALWLDDELTGESLAAVEAWALTQPEQLEARQAIRRWRGMLAAALPSTEEPAFPDFFNSRILQEIQKAQPKPLSAVKPGWGWKAWFMPLAACVGMIFTFFAGMKVRQPAAKELAIIPRAIIVEPSLYTPENGVEAEWFSSKTASATIIVLKGVAAIPDNFDFSETAYEPSPSDIDATAFSEVKSQREDSF